MVPQQLPAKQTKDIKIPARRPRKIFHVIIVCFIDHRQQKQG